MKKSIVIQIGNSDDKLTQKKWANFVKYVREELSTPAVDFHFFGFSPGDAHWQNCCMVFNVDHEALGYPDFEFYLNDLRYILGQAARKYHQDSIALLVGETEFVPFNYETKEKSGYYNQEGNGEEGDEDLGQEGNLSGQEDRYEHRRKEGAGSKSDQGGRSTYPHFQGSSGCYS